MNTTQKTTRKRSLTEERVANHKLALFIASAISFAVNLMLIVLLAIDGISFLYVMFPMLFCILSVAFIVLSSFTNFRFSYSLWYTVSYSLLFAATAIMFGLVLMGFGKESAMTYFAIGLWALVNLLNLIAIIVGVSRAAGFRGGFRSVLMIALLLVSIGGYVYFVTSAGFFGQGSDSSSRPVTFIYDDEEKYYVATGTLKGKGKTVTVPGTFNSIKVGAIDCSLFTTEGINTVELLCSDDVEFRNTTELLAAANTISVKASRETLDGMTETIYTMAAADNHNADSLLAFAGSFSPSDLASDEVYVTFTYTAESVKAAEGNFMPMWTGKVGEAFTLDYAKDLNYIKYSDVSDESILAKLYEDDAANGGQILSAITDSKGNSLVGAKITSNMDNVCLTFDKIYRVEVKADNDDDYELEDGFRFLTDETPYRYVTAKTASALLPTANGRNGFTLAWGYSLGSDNTVNALPSLEEIVTGQATEQIAIYPEWTLKAPTINSCTTAGIGNTYTYGDNVSFTSSATAPDSSIDLIYEWFVDGQSVATGRGFDITKVKMTEAGTYTVRVTAYSDTVTSLTSVSTETLDLTVNKKELPISWNVFSSEDGEIISDYVRVYSAKSSDVDFTYDAEALVYGDDTITWELNKYAVTNAGSHTVTATLTGDCADKYFINDSVKSNVYVINPAEITLTFSNFNNQTYNGSPLYPTVENSPLQGADSVANLGLSVTGKTHVADSNTVYATITDTNYKIVVDANETYSVNNAGAAVFNNFTINPAPLTLSFYNVSKTYTSYAQRPSVDVTGLCGSDDAKLNISSKTNVSDTDAITVTSANTDYKFVLDWDNTYTLGEHGEVLFSGFSITPAELTLSFTDVTKVYNAEIQYPTVTTHGLLGADTRAALGLSIGGKTNVSESANDITVSITNTNYKLATESGESYSVNLAGNAIYTGFTITRAPITVIWENTTHFTYNSDFIFPKVSSWTGVYEKDSEGIKVFTHEDNSKQESASSSAYTAYATMTDSNTVTGNYELVNNVERQFYIDKKDITVSWSGSTFVYSKENKLPSVEATVAGGVVEGDTVNVTASGEKIDVGNYTATVTTDNENYNITNKTFGFTITPKPITVVWSSNTTFIYSGSLQAPTVSTGNDVCSGDTVELTVGGKQKNASTASYTATVTTSNANYTITNNTQSYTIGKRDLTINWSNTSLTYNSALQKPTAVAGDGYVSGDNLGLVVSGAQENASTAPYVATVAITDPTHAGNYNILNYSASFSIGKQALTIVWGTTTHVYDGTSWAPTPTPGAGYVGNDSLSLTVEGHATNYSENEYYATVTIGNATHAGNYDVTNPIQSFTITKRPVTVVWTGTTLTYNKTAQKPTASINANVVSGDTVNLTVVGEQINAGTGYTASVSTDNANYQLSNTTTTFKINPKTVTVSWGTNVFTYDRASHVPTPSIVGGVEAGDEVTVSANGAQTNAGTGYVATAVLNNNNYTTSSTTTFTINPKGISVTWNVGTYTYNGSYQGPTAEAGASNGVISGDIVSVTVTQSKNAGNHTATATSDNGNYVITSNSTQGFNIAKKPVRVEWTVSTLIYNKSTQMPTAVANADDVCSGDTVTISRTGAIGAGTHTSTATSDNSNYVVTAETATKEFTIAKKSISLSWTYLSLTYNGQAQKPTASTGTSYGVCSGDYVSVTVNGAQTNAGSYTATATISNDNYEINSSFVSTNYTINAKQLTINWGTTSFTFNGDVQTPTASVSGVVYGDDVSVTVSGGQTNVGSYTATATLTGADKANYKFSNGTQTTTKSFSIGAATVYIDWSHANYQQFTYTGSNVGTTTSISFVAYGQTITLTLTYKVYKSTGWQTTTSHSARGDYMVTATLKTANSNIVLADTTRYFDIV